MALNGFARPSGTQCPSDAPRVTSDLPAGDVIVLHGDNGRHAYHALTLAMVALDALATDQSSRALGCAQGARYGCPKAAASSLQQIVWTKAPFFTHPKEVLLQRTGSCPLAMAALQCTERRNGAQCFSACRRPYSS